MLRFVTGGPGALAIGDCSRAPRHKAALMGDKNPKQKDKNKKQDTAHKDADKAKADAKRAPPPAAGGKKGK